MESSGKEMLNEALNNMNSEEVASKIRDLTSNREFVDSISSELLNNPSLMDLAPKLAGDPRINDLVKDSNMTRKEALKLKKEISKSAHEKKSRSRKILGCIITNSRTVKSITVFANDKDQLLSEIIKHIRPRPAELSSRKFDDFNVFFDRKSKAKNKRIIKAFGKEVTGGSVIIISDKGDLSVEEFEKWESKRT